ncbi:MAG: hypothetical protein R3F54_11870 [Alphaproteobacteria bacterium]
MDGSRTRLRINLSQGEFEVEGSEAFVERYAQRIDALFAGLKDGRGAEPSPAPALPAETASRSAGAGSSNGAARNGTAPEHLGEWLEHMPRSATDVDRMLLAGYYAQLRSGDNSFGTGEANALLTDQGIKVGNPSQCVKQNLVAKRVFKHLRRYRVSQTGLDQLRQLIGPAFDG